jgi:dTDP-4-dehydrorhamnose 3,5-epimerase
MTDTWRLAGAVKDRQTITARWTPSAQQLIDGVTIREVLNVPKANGYLTEMYRGGWAESSGGIDQVFQVVLDPGAISAWHAHADTIDR